VFLPQRRGDGIRSFNADQLDGDEHRGLLIVRPNCQRSGEQPGLGAVSLRRAGPIP
jgi:hypothetical protein